MNELESETRPPRPWGMGILAVVGTYIFPGLGHLFARRPRRAAVWLLIAVVAQFGSMMLVTQPRLGFVVAAAVLGTCSAVLVIWTLVDAFLCGRRATRPLLGRAWQRYGLAVVQVVGSVWFHPWGWLGERLAYYVWDNHVAAFELSTGSMIPTLQVGDRVIMHRNAEWERWSVVAIDHPRYPDALIVKRVLGLPGERVEIIDGELHIDGQLTPRPTGVPGYINEPYVGYSIPGLRGKPGVGTAGNPIALEADEVYVVGDNSEISLDSRGWEDYVGGRQRGAVPVELVKGRATAIYWPLSRWRWLGD